MRPTSFDGFDGANDGVSKMLKQGGIVLISARKKCDFVKTSEYASEKLREWYCNRDSHKMSTHHPRFGVKDLRRARVRWRTRQDHVAEPGVPAMNENDWSGGRHLCPREGQTGGMAERGRDQTDVLW